MIPRLNTEHEVALGHLDFFSKAKVCSVSSTQFHCLFVPLVSCSVSGPCSVFMSVEKRLFFLFLSLLCVHLSRTCILVVVTVPKQLNSMKRQWSISSSMMVLKGCKSHTMKKLTYVLELFIFENHECPTFNLVNVKLENCVAVR